MFDLLTNAPALCTVHSVFGCCDSSRSADTVLLQDTPVDLDFSCGAVQRGYCFHFDRFTAILRRDKTETGLRFIMLTVMHVTSRRFPWPWTFADSLLSLTPIAELAVAVHCPVAIIEHGFDTALLVALDLLDYFPVALNLLVDRCRA